VKQYAMNCPFNPPTTYKRSSCNRDMASSPTLLPKIVRKLLKI